MKPLALSVILSAFVAPPLLAAQVTLTVDQGAAVSYTLNNLSVTSAGDVVLSVTSGGTVTPPPVNPPPVDPPPVNPPPVVGACVSAGNLKCESTPLPASYLIQTTRSPAPADIYAFSFGTVASGSYIGNVNVARTSSSTASKLIVISTQPGDVNVLDKPRGCFAYSVEVSTVRYVVNYPTASTSTYCHLQPGTTYYFNVASQTTMSTEQTCTSGKCSFSVSAK